VVCTCNDRYLEDWGRGISWTQEFRANLNNIVRPYLKNKNRQKEREHDSSDSKLA
jgi:hypothetical protein